MGTRGAWARRGRLQNLLPGMDLYAYGVVRLESLSGAGYQLRLKVGGRMLWRWCKRAYVNVGTGKGTTKHGHVAALIITAGFFRVGQVNVYFFFWIGRPAD